MQHNTVYSLSKLYKNVHSKEQKYNANSLWVDFKFMVESNLESVSNYTFWKEGEVQKILLRVAIKLDFLKIVCIYVIANKSLERGWEENKSL